MSRYRDMIECGTVRHSNRVKKFCDPLFECFNLNQFYYVKITDNGSMYSLDSHLPFIDYWASEKWKLSYPFYRHPRFIKEDVNVITDTNDPNLKGMISSLKELFNFQSWLRIVNRVSDGIEEFGFSSPSASTMQIAMMQREVPLFQLFLKNFKKENTVVFSKLEDHQIDIANMVGLDFYKDDLPVIPRSEAINKLLRSFGREESLLKSDLLMLKFLLDGLSAGHIAVQVSLSKRTIEHRMERLKEKLGCHSKAELIQKARDLEHLGALYL